MSQDLSEQQQSRPAPLAGVRVIEFGTFIAGALATRILGDFGAEVIKIEAPGEGDPLRRWGERPYEGRYLLWYIYSRNKRCVSLDLRKPRGQEIARRLLARSDVLVENFRPGTLDKWGLDDASLRALNPRLVVTHVSGFGQTGPYRDRGGFGSVGEAMGGLRYLTGDPDRPPVRTGVSIGDSLASLHAVVGTLLALRSRDQHGAGQSVDVAIYEAVFNVMESLIPEYALTGLVRERTGSILPNVAPSNIYRTRDQLWMIIAANSDSLFARLATAMGQPHLAQDERFATHIARGRNMAELDGLIQQWVTTIDASALQAILDAHGVPCGPIYTAREMLADPHFAARELIQAVPAPWGEDMPTPTPLPKLSDTPGSIQWLGPPTVGQHNRDVYVDLLGLQVDEVNQLAETGII